MFDPDSDRTHSTGSPLDDDDEEVADSSDATSPFWADPNVPAAERGSIARRACLALGIMTALNCVLVVALAAWGEERMALGVLLGHLIYQGLTASWVIGALLTFRSSNLAFMVGTIGATPLRLLFLVLVLILLVTQFKVHVAALTSSMLVTMIYGFFVEGWTFNALAKPIEPG